MKSRATPMSAKNAPRQAHCTCPVIKLPGRTLMPCRIQTNPRKIIRAARMRTAKRMSFLVLQISLVSARL